MAAVVAALIAACSAPPRHEETLGVDAGTSTATRADGMATAAGTSAPTPTDGFADGDRPPADLGAPCDPSRSVQSNGAALLVQDPEVLSRFPLDRALGQIIATAGEAESPTELLQRLFDTENTAAAGVFAGNVHCDDADNPAFLHAKAVGCPRAEGKLAQSAGLFVPGDPDHFEPIALVNRFDLMPWDFSSCGEYRIVYAKRSGRSDPDDRAFLILEGALANPIGSLAGCRPVAELWAALEDLVSSASVADRLEKFYFEGLDGFAPVVHANHYGLNQPNCAYSGGCGHLRLAQGMQTPWELRQFQLQKLPAGATGSVLQFAPTPDTNSPRPELFDPAITDARGGAFRASFIAGLAGLTEPEVPRMRIPSFPDYEAGQSAVEGPAQPNYLSRVTQGNTGNAFAEQIAQGLNLVELPACPTEDPITVESILQRATALTCAGCHAPERLLSSERRIGCGQVWPKSLGQAHIDEQGRLSEALTRVFLPHRANVLGTYLQACDEGAIIKNLQPVPVQVTF